MRVYMESIMKDMNDKEINEQIPSGEKNLMGSDIMKDGMPLTLRKVCQNALVGTYQDEQSLSGEEKVRRWSLAMKIKKSPDPVDLVSDEVVLVKKLIGKAYGPIICGPAWMLLEGGPSLDS